MNRLKRTVAIVLIALSFGGCSQTGWRVADMLFRTVATVAYVAYVVSHHDDHYHHSTCGHPSVVVDGRHVHKYQDRWEYWDEERGEWYYYPDARFEDDWDYR